jgi:hypothetical protein
MWQIRLVPNLASVTVLNNVATLNLSILHRTTNYTLVMQHQDTNNALMFSSIFFSFNYNTSVSLASNFVTVNEAVGTLSFV